MSTDFKCKMSLTVISLFLVTNRIEPTSGTARIISSNSAKFRNYYNSIHFNHDCTLRPAHLVLNWEERVKHKIRYSYKGNTKHSITTDP